MSKEQSATSHGLTGELREAAAYYSSASDPNLRQQSELCKRAADLYEKQQQRFAKQTDYGIHLQRIIESICHGRDIPEGSKAEAAFHAEMAEKFLSARSETVRKMNVEARDLIFDTMGSALAYIQHVGANHVMRGEPHPQQWLVENLQSSIKIFVRETSPSAIRQNKCCSPGCEENASYCDGHAYK